MLNICIGDCLRYSHENELLRQCSVGSSHHLCSVKALFESSCSSRMSDNLSVHGVFLSRGLLAGVDLLLRLSQCLQEDLCSCSTAAARPVTCPSTINYFGKLQSDEESSLGREENLERRVGARSTCVEMHWVSNAVVVLMGFGREKRLRLVTFQWVKDCEIFPSFVGGTFN